MIDELFKASNTVALLDLNSIIFADLGDPSLVVDLVQEDLLQHVLGDVGRLQYLGTLIPGLS